MPDQRAEAEKLALVLGNRKVGVFGKAVMQVPIESAREARAVPQLRLRSNDWQRLNYWIGEGPCTGVRPLQPSWLRLRATPSVIE